MEKADKAAELFTLGAQDDGSIVLRLPDEYHRVVAQKAIEKQLKNTGAAEGTVSALADGVDPFLARVRGALEKVQQLLVGARPAGNQLDNTPMGEAMKSASTDTGGGIMWADDVPTPRPKVGDLVRWPTGQAESVTAIEGYDPNSKAFVAESEDSKFTGIIAHPTNAGEWALLPLLLDYDGTGAGAAELPEGEQADVLVGGGVDAFQTANAERDAQDERDGQDEPAQPVKGKSAQRAKNMQHNGVKKSASSTTRPAPKPSAKKGSRKGGK